MQFKSHLKPVIVSIAAYLLSGCTQEAQKQAILSKPREPAQNVPAHQQAGIVPLPVDANIFVNLAKKVVPSVVNISTSKTFKSPLGQGAPDDLYRRFFEDFLGPGFGGGPQFGDPRRKGRKNPKDLPKSVSLGTGFIIDSSGLILTNNHVVADADEIKVNFTESLEEKPTDGEVVGRDPDLDVALIRVKSKREMIPLSLGDSDALEVGEYVMAVGNPFGQGHSVTHGIISAKGRAAPNFPLATYLQTDAPINPGNSGGPLVNLKGAVVGINNAIEARAQGIGFAIPSSIVTQILPQLKTKGSVERGYIGTLIGDLSPELAEKLGVSKDLKAPFVTHVTSGEPADQAGIQPYDIILEVNGKKPSTSSELVAAITSIPVGETAEIKISRNGKPLTTKVKVAKRPNAQDKIERNKKPSQKDHLDTGMSLENLTPDLASQLGIPSKVTGVVISAIEYGSPADKAGLSRGDAIVEVDRKPVKDVDTFYSVVKEKKSYLLRVLKTAASQGQPVYGVSILDLK
jgi:serine protease Do